MSSKPVLSKSTFIKGLQCDKSLYLYKHHYNWHDQVSQMQQSVFDRGHRIGALAQSVSPGGIDASYPGFKIILKKNLYIVDKGSASVAYESLIEERDMFKINETRKNLLEYCKLDTLAMVEILNKLQ